MEIPRTSHNDGGILVVSNGSPEAFDLSTYAGRYVKLICPAQDLWFNVTDDGDTGTTLDRTGESTAFPADDVADFVQAKSPEHIYLAPGRSRLVVEPDSGSDVVIIVKPTSSDENFARR